MICIVDEDHVIRKVSVKDEGDDRCIYTDSPNNKVANQFLLSYKYKEHKSFNVDPKELIGLRRYSAVHYLVMCIRDTMESEGYI